MKRVSIKDVAREAGVSATTVSYVLNRNPDETISAETTQRVLEAVRRLHYVPNLNARSLSSRRSNLIGVLIPQTEPGKEFMLGALRYLRRAAGQPAAFAALRLLRHGRSRVAKHRTRHPLRGLSPVLRA